MWWKNLLPDDLTFTEWLLAIIILLGGWWIYKNHQRQLDDRQKEINRLAQDNREYRERFLQILDRDFGIKSDRDNGSRPATGDKS